MGIIQSLTELGLKQLMGDGAELVLGLARERFTDQGRRVLEALNNANQRAWQTLEIALAGASLWDKVKARREDLAFAGELQAFLNAAPLAELAAHPHSREQCLSELRQARQRGVVPGQLSAEDLPRHADPRALLAVEASALAGIAQELTQQNCAWLAWLIQQRPSGGAPLLTLAVRYFFRREVEEDEKLSRGLTFQGLEGASQAQAEGLRNLHDVLTTHGQRVEGLLDAVRIGIDEIKGGVLDLRTEMQRLGQNLQAESRALHEAVVKMLEEHQLHARPIRPRDSQSIRTDQDRELVKALLCRYRSLPEGQGQLTAALANGAAQLQLAVGDHEGAQRDFATAARLTPDPRAQAEAHFNTYRAALAGGRYDEALGEMKQALVRDAGRFAPFPLNEYEPLRILGVGGFGVTFLCRNKLLGSKVAVKAIVREDLERNVGLVFQEAAALDQLHHPAIIQLRHCGYADAERTRPYVAMEYFEGQTLDQYVQTNGPLPWDDFKDVSQLVVAALAAAHARGILHRDVKPANLLIRKAEAGWEVRLIDFGLSMNQAALDAVSTVNQGYGVTGTLDYAAPEQLGKLPGVRIGPRADIYGFAKTCCFALFGTPQPQLQHWKKVSPGMAKLLDACVTENPAGRPESMAWVLQELRKVRKKPRPRSPTDIPEMEPVPPRLLALRGLKRGVEYPLHEGPNFIGRADETPVDVDLEDQEPADRVWSSRRHAVITCEGDSVTIEDLKSANGTYVNRTRLPPEQKRLLQSNDVIQIGGVHLQLKVGEE